MALSVDRSIEGSDFKAWKSHWDQPVRIGNTSGDSNYQSEAAASNCFTLQVKEATIRGRRLLFEGGDYYYNN